MAPWKPGQSGNPAGRSKLPIEELRAHARIYTADAVRTLVRALSDRSGQVRVMAADKLLSRGWGVPGVQDGDALAGSVVIHVVTGIDRRPLPDGEQGVTDVQPLLEHEPDDADKPAVVHARPEWQAAPRFNGRRRTA